MQFISIFRTLLVFSATLLVSQIQAQPVPLAINTSNLSIRSVAAEQKVTLTQETFANEKEQFLSARAESNAHPLQDTVPKTEKERSLIKKLKKWVKEKKQKPERFEVKYNANGDTFFREKGTGEEWKMV